jgi:hypothetical protein
VPFATCRFLMAERLVAKNQSTEKKLHRTPIACPYRGPSSPPVLRAQQYVNQSIAALRHRLSYPLIERLE